MSTIFFLQLSLTPLLIAMLSASSCALAGSFLVMRKQALIGDTISHVVLLGIVLAFTLTGQLNSWLMMLGSLFAAALAALIIEMIHRLAKLESTAAMGITFTTFFATGVLLLELSGSSSVHLDVEHALMGNIESLIWLDATSWSSLLDPLALALLPIELPRLVLVFAVLACLLFIFWRPLVITTFDEGFAQANGIQTKLVSLAIILGAALAAVAAFDAVGAILSIAMFVCPAASARLLARSMAQMIALALLFANISAGLGFFVAGHLPLWLGFDASLSAAGMIACVSGLILWSIMLIKAYRR